MDTLGGTCASSSSVPPRYVVTRGADVHYLRPVLGTEVRCTTKTVKAGRQTCLVQAEVFDDQDRLCAEGLLEFFYLDKEIEM